VIRQLRLTAALLCMAMLLVACGTRVTDEQRALVMSSGGGGFGEGGTAVASGGGAVDLGAPGADVGDLGGEVAFEDVEPGAAPVEGDTAPTGGTDTDGAPASSPDGSGAAPDGGGEAPQQSASGGEGTSGTGGGGGGLDPRQVPPGGNGGATDTGVTESKLVVANIADVSGAVPGLFEPEQLAARARVAFENARGPIFGRQLELLPLDGRMNAGANRAATIEACERAFAGVGSMSAFDQGGAPVAADCGMPDVRTAATTPPMQAVDSAYPLSITRPGKEAIGQYRWFHERFPEAGKAAAFLYIDGEVTAQSTKKTRDATTKALGWNWKYVQPIQIAETNYAPFVLRMKEEGIRFVTFQGAYQQAVRIAQAMQQQGFTPDVYVLQSNTYNPETIQSGGAAVEGIYIPIMTVMVEESANNPELQRYAQWLNQVAPGKRPTSLGMYSWSATSLLIDIAKKVGPDLTREKVLAELANVRQWDGNGLHPPIDVGARTPNQCFIMTQIKGGRFTRAHPASGFDCAGPTVEGL
jgi:ABC-type branched-subunit amino acid transport system substrate-binding protein